MVALFSNCPVAYQILQVILFVLLLAAFFPVLYIPKKKKKIETTITELSSP